MTATLAEEASASEPVEAPYGWMTDPITKERRPRKSPANNTGPRTKAAPAAPKKKAPRSPSAKPSGVSSTAKLAEREEAITGLFQIAQFGLIMRAQTVAPEARGVWLADAGAVGVHAEKISHETAVLANHNAGFGRVIDVLTVAGPYTALFAAVVPLGVQVLANHGRVNPSVMPGVLDPNALAQSMVSELQPEEAAPSANGSSAS